MLPFLLLLFVGLAGIRFGLSLEFLRNTVFIICLFMLSLQDIKDRRIPDIWLIFILAAWILTVPWMGFSLGNIVSRVSSLLFYGGGLALLVVLFEKTSGRESLGGGDIKLIGLVGLYLGLEPTLFALLLACIFGLVTAGIYKICLQRRKETTSPGEAASLGEAASPGGAFPFGPAISLAAWVMLLYGDRVLF